MGNGLGTLRGRDSRGDRLDKKGALQKMKTSAMRHQAVALERMAGREYFALFMEQGTGKTWCLLAEVKKQPPNLTAGEFNRSE